MSTEVKIHEYQPAYAEVFYRLNEAWISKYFVMEPSDHAYLNHPQEKIIDHGGYILFAEYENKIVGCCALINNENGIYELSKMAVDPAAQGKHIGKILGEAIIQKARSIGAKKVFLNSNTILETAINLYKKLGFTEVPINMQTYVRSNIQMEMYLQSQEP